MPLRRAGPDKQGGENAARHRRKGNGREMLPEQHHRHQHAAPRAGIQAHHVRAAEGLRISDWNIAPLTPSAAPTRSPLPRAAVAIR